MQMRLHSLIAAVWFAQFLFAQESAQGGFIALVTEPRQQSVVLGANDFADRAGLMREERRASVSDSGADRRRTGSSRAEADDRVVRYTKAMLVMIAKLGGVGSAGGMPSKGNRALGGGGVPGAVADIPRAIAANLVLVKWLLAREHIWLPPAFGTGVFRPPRSTAAWTLCANNMQRFSRVD